LPIKITNGYSEVIYRR